MPTKAAQRRAALGRRQALAPADVARRSEQLAAQLFRHFPVAEWRWLHLFLPLAARHEPDTGPIMRRVWAEGLPLRLAVPVVQPDGRSLQHYELTPTTALHANRWGIPEPTALAGPAVAPAAFDAVLVPLLAVDETGHRVGYGGGFYDRFLAQCRPGTVLIGLNVLDEAPGTPLADVLATDVRLHACLTPGGAWWF